MGPPLTALPSSAGLTCESLPSSNFAALGGRRFSFVDEPEELEREHLNAKEECNAKADLFFEIAAERTWSAADLFALIGTAIAYRQLAQASTPDPEAIETLTEAATELLRRVGLIERLG